MLGKILRVILGHWLMMTSLTLVGGCEAAKQTAPVDLATVADAGFSEGGDSSCVPNCGSRQCGLDPVCRLPCGTSCPAGEFCNGEGTCQTAPPAFAVAAGGVKPDRGQGLALDAEGNVLLAGYFQGEATFGSSAFTAQGVEDFFLSKISPAGVFEWTLTAGGPQYDGGTSVAVDKSGNVFVAGYFYENALFGAKTLTSKGYRDVFVAKVLAGGTFDWVVAAGGAASDKASGIALDQSGNAYVIGYFGSQSAFGTTTLTSQGKYDLFVAKVRSSGTFEWATAGGGSGDDLGTGIAVDHEGHVYATGFFAGQASFGSAGAIPKTSTGAEDLFVAKLKPSGSFEWVSTAGGPGADRGYRIAPDGSGNLYVTGYFEEQVKVGSTSLVSQGDKDAWVIKVLPAGTFDWALAAGGTGSDTAQAIAVDSTGTCYITGHYEGQSDFGSATGAANVFVARVSPSGKLEYVTAAGGAGWKEATDIALDGSGAVYATGAFEDAAEFGGASLSSTSSSDDVFLWKVRLQ